MRSTGKRHLYMLIDPRNKEVFYIGQTSNPSARLKQHCAIAKFGTKNQRRIYDIISSGQFPVMNVFFTVNRDISVKQFEAVEKMAIKRFLKAGYRLENTSL